VAKVSHTPETTPIPVQLSEKDFTEFILPHLSMPKRGPKCKIGYRRLYNLILWLLHTGAQWKTLAIPNAENGQPIIHYTSVHRRFARRAKDGSLERAHQASVQRLHREGRLDLSVLHGDGSNTVAKKGGDLIGHSGHKHQRGEKIIAVTDNHGFVISALTAAPVNRADTVLLPDGVKRLKLMAKAVGLVLIGAIFNLDAGFDSKANRKHIFNAGMKPNVKENPRNRKNPKRGRKRLFDPDIYALRYRVEPTFAREDKFKRLLIRFERLNHRHLAMKLMDFTQINLRVFCSH
jgi:transposase